MVNKSTLVDWQPVFSEWLTAAAISILITAGWAIRTQWRILTSAGCAWSAGERNVETVKHRNGCNLWLWSSDVVGWTFDPEVKTLSWWSNLAEYANRSFETSNALSALCHALTTCGFVVTEILHAHWFSGHVDFVVSGNNAFWLVTQLTRQFGP